MGRTRLTAGDGPGSRSGHEPAHVMTIGKGMLDAACPGDVFAAPPADFVYETVKLVTSPKGVLLLVNNYTGDRMAFEMAEEPDRDRHRARIRGRRITHIECLSAVRCRLDPFR
ncbi:dihydroxyacetone kinase subunit DhaK [Streptomyces sp. NPDC059340]|uniref:dihydroxyacetone kinase subunit DhaK n=1 Tax=Streptomyces sp. NPDC059340 TaxID=3346806 RepID=UPI0036B26B0B